MNVCTHTGDFLFGTSEIKKKRSCPCALWYLSEVLYNRSPDKTFFGYLVNRSFAQRCYPNTIQTKRKMCVDGVGFLPGLPRGSSLDINLKELRNSSGSVFNPEEVNNLCQEVWLVTWQSDKSANVPEQWRCNHTLPSQSHYRCPPISQYFTLMVITGISRRTVKDYCMC